MFTFFIFKQKTAYERRISDWSSDVCSSDLWSQGQLRISICQNRNVLGTKQVLDEDSPATRKSELPCLTRIWTSFRKTKPSALPQYGAMRFSIRLRTVPLIASPR